MTLFELSTMFVKIYMVLTEPDDLLTDEEREYRDKFIIEYEKLKPKKAGTQEELKGTWEEQLEYILETIKKQIIERRSN